MRHKALLPRRVDGLAYQERRIRARPRAEFLHAAAVDFCCIEVAFLIDAETVDAPESAGEIAADASGVEEVALQIVLEHLRCSAIGRPKHPVGANV